MSGMTIYTGAHSVGAQYTSDTARAPRGSGFSPSCSYCAVSAARVAEH